jgi:hypothetical protein
MEGIDHKSGLAAAGVDDEEIYRFIHVDPEGNVYITDTSVEKIARRVAELINEQGE